MSIRFAAGTIIAAALGGDSASAQTLDSVRIYARELYAAEQLARSVEPSSMDDMRAASAAPGWAAALADVVPPEGFERLHRSLVRNSRIIVSTGNRLRAAPEPGAAEDLQRELSAAVAAYYQSRVRLGRQLKADWGIELPGWYVRRAPGSG
jgi:hypothetical protein